MGEGAHLTLTPTRQPTRADSARAAAIADTLRRAIAKYADVRFLPRLFGWMVHADVLESDDPATIWTAPHNHQHPS